MRTQPITTALGNNVTLVTWPAVQYIQVEDLDRAVNMTTMKKFAVLIGDMHHKFGFGTYSKDRETVTGPEKKGEPYSYGLGAMISDIPRPVETYVAFHFEQLVIVNDRLYRLRRAPNNNVEFEAVDKPSEQG